MKLSWHWLKELMLDSAQVNGLSASGVVELGSYRRSGVSARYVYGILKVHGSLYEVVAHNGTILGGRKLYFPAERSV